MKPSLQFCAKQISRLASKRNRPYGEGDEYRLQNVIEVLQDAAESEEHATRIVDRLEQGDTFPCGYDIRQTAHDLRTREKAPDASCAKCRGLGWVQEPFSYMFGGRSINTTRSGRCTCWKDVEVPA